MSSILEAAMAGVVDEEMVRRTLMVNGRRTGIRVSSSIWDALDRIAREERKPVRQIISEIATAHGTGDGAAGLVAAVHVFVLKHVQTQADRPEPDVMGGMAVQARFGGPLHLRGGLREGVSRRL